MPAISYETLGYHCTPIRVRFGEIDGYGYLWHGHALTYFEQARADLARSYGISAAELLRNELAIPMVEQSATYKSPAHDDDGLVVQTTLMRPSVPLPFLLFCYRIIRDGTDEEVLRGTTKQVFVRTGGALVTRLPPAIREGLRTTWSYLSGCPRWPEGSDR